jgi:hypothetical protein
VYISWRNKETTIKSNSLDKIGIEENEDIDFDYYFNGDLDNLPQVVNVYEMNNVKLEDIEIKKLIGQFGFEDSEVKLGRYNYIASNDNITVTFDTRSNYLQYGNKVEPSKSSRLDQNELLDIAKKFLAKNNLISNEFNLVEVEVSMLSTDGYNYKQVENYNEAKFLEIRFGLALNGIEIINRERKSNIVDIVMNLDGSVNKATVFYLRQGALISEVGQAKLNDPKRALKEIKEGRGIISEVKDPTQSYTNLEEEDFEKNVSGLGKIDIGKNVFFKEAAVVYVWDNETNFIQPYYQFSGTVATVRTDNVAVKILIEALPEYLYKEK